MLTHATHVNGWFTVIYILHELHESKFPFVSRIEFIRSKLSNFSAHVYGAIDVLRVPLAGDGSSSARNPGEGGSSLYCVS